MSRKTRVEVNSYFKARNAKFTGEPENYGKDMDLDNQAIRKPVLNYDDIGNAVHYNAHLLEYIRATELKYGTFAAMIICISQVDKYSLRAGLKKGNSVEQELMKRDWFLKVYNHMKGKLKGELTGKSNKIVDMPEELLDILFNENNTVTLKEITSDG